MPSERRMEGEYILNHPARRCKKKQKTTQLCMSQATCIERSTIEYTMKTVRADGGLRRQSIPDPYSEPISLFVFSPSLLYSPEDENIQQKE